jgi:cyclomaltodextrinase / maltogenic alpha-amylase / neopullulanase
MKTNFYSVVFMAILFTVFACKANENMTQKTSDSAQQNWWKNKVIYEVNLRQFSKEGTFKGFEKHLPRLKKLGVDILWFMPINPIGEKNRKGSLGSYYSVKDYLKVNPEFGTMDDFKSLVQKIHKMDLYVIIDWVANHCAWDNHLVTEHPDWFTKNKKGNLVPPVDDWTDVVDFDYNSQDSRKYMADALKFWITETDIDGYRCDVAEMVPFDFWNPTIARLRKVKPVFMLAEAGSPECHNNGFNATYGWDVYHMVNDIASGKKPLKELARLLKEENKLVSNGVYRMNFTSNHDENSWNGTVFERLGNGVEAFAAFTFLIPGFPLLYNGQEVGLDKRLSFFEKDVINWGNNQYTELYMELIKFYKSNKSLIAEDAENNFEIVKTTDEKNILAFLRIFDSKKVLSLFNFSPKKTSFNFKEFKQKDIFKSILPNQTYGLEIDKPIGLNPWEYVIFSNE